MPCDSPHRGAERGDLHDVEQEEGPAEPRPLAVLAGRAQQREPEVEEEDVADGLHLGDDRADAELRLARLGDADEGRENGGGEALARSAKVYRCAAGALAGRTLKRSAMSSTPVDHCVAWQMSSSPASIFSARHTDVHMKQSMSVNGKPATMDTACTAPSVLARLVADDEQRDGDEALGPAPEDLLHDGGLGHAVGGDDVVDVRPGVGGGDEVQRDTDEQNRPQERLHLAVGDMTSKSLSLLPRQESR